MIRNELCLRCSGYTQPNGCVGKIELDDYCKRFSSYFDNDCDDTDNPFGESLAEDCPF